MKRLLRAGSARLYYLSAMQMRALIIDDELHARENLRMLIDEFCPELAVVGDAAGVDDGLVKVRELKPDVVFLDIRMPRDRKSVV